jgi:HlyD family secretion protein
MKKWPVVIVTLGLLSGGWWYWSSQKAQAAEASASSNEPELAEVELATIDLRVATTGRINASLDVEIKSKANGLVINLPFDVSDFVTSGQLIAELDPVDELRAVENRQASVNSARARVIQAEQQLELALLDETTETSAALAEFDNARIRLEEVRTRVQRQTDLRSRNLVSQEAFDAARAELANQERSFRLAEISVANIKRLPRLVELRRQDLAQARAELARTTADLEANMDRLRETKIFAPFDGTITNRPVQVGQIIASGISNVGGGTTLMTLSDLSRLLVVATVDESDIGKVRVGQQVVITADAFPGQRFRGQVERIAAKGTNTQNVITFDVQIEIVDQEKSRLKPEMTANVEIAADRREDVPAVPSESVQFDRNGYFVEVPGDEGTTSTKRVAVGIGITDGIKTEITSGLELGQKVIRPGSNQSRFARGGANNLDRSLRRTAFSVSGGRGGRGGR